MTPKEKAQQLLWKYLPLIDGWTSPRKTELAKKLALVCVDECIKSANLMDGGFSFEKEIEFWKQVKVEINNL